MTNLHSREGDVALIRAALRQPVAIHGLCKAFNPDQPRDERGRFASDGGADSGAAGDALLAHVDQSEFDRLSSEAAADLQSMYGRAAEAKPDFDAAMERVAAALGGQAKLPKLKGSARAVDKIVSDYAGDSRQIKDLLRGTIEVNTLSEARAALTALRAEMNVNETSGFRDTLRPEALEPIDGYRDIKFNVKLPGGVTAEVQINLPQMLEVKSRYHKQYEDRSAIQRRGWEANRDPTPAEQREIDRLNTEMREAYRAPWEALTRVQKADSLIRTPLRMALSAGNLRGGDTSQAAQCGTLPPLPRDTGTPSTSNRSAPGGRVCLLMKTSDATLSQPAGTVKLAYILGGRNG